MSDPPHDFNLDLEMSPQVLDGLMGLPCDIYGRSDTSNGIRATFESVCNSAKTNKFYAIPAFFPESLGCLLNIDLFLLVPSLFVLLFSTDLQNLFFCIFGL